jgi:hypothetical protein
MTLLFAEKFPALFHVTRRSAVEGIKRNGLRSPANLADYLGIEIPININRDTWAKRLDLEGRPIWLRWQRLSDQVLLNRLPPAITPGQWRTFINGLVFLFPSLQDAAKLRNYPKDTGVDQLILKFSTVTLIQAGCDIRVCRWNNGFPDRSRPLRLREFSDYRPVTKWQRGDKVKEVTITHSIQASVPFEIVPGIP